MFNPQVSNLGLDSRHSNDPPKRSLPRLPQVMTLIIITSFNSSLILFYLIKLKMLPKTVWLRTHVRLWTNGCMIQRQSRP